MSLCIKRKRDTNKNQNMYADIAVFFARLTNQCLFVSFFLQIHLFAVLVVFCLFCFVTEKKNKNKITKFTQNFVRSFF